MTITFDRNIAVTRGEMDFVTWDHPLVHGVMELLLGTEQGNCAFARCRADGEFQLLLETIYLLECVVPGHLHMDSFLPVTPIRVVVNHQFDEITADCSQADFHKMLMDGDGGFLREYPEIKEALLPGMIRASADMAETHSKGIIAKARKEMTQTLGKEVDRLTWLQQKNPAVDEHEVDMARTALQNLDKALSTARLRLDALRMVRVG